LLPADVLAGAGALGTERFDVVGHDFGGMVAWHAAVYAPDRVCAVASLCTPHGPRGRTDIVESYKRHYGDTHYMTTFQTPGAAEAIFEADLERTFRNMLRGVGVSLPEFRTLSAKVQALPMGLFIGDPQLFDRPVVTDDDLQVYVTAYRERGFRGPLSWYRSLHRTWQEADGVDMTIDKPALLIQAAGDFFLAPDQRDLTDQYAKNLERHVVAGCGHWIQQERPDAVNALLVEWLRRFAR